MRLFLKCRRVPWPATLLLAGFLAGCGGGDASSAPPLQTLPGGGNTGGNGSVNPLTNPDVVLFASGRTPDGSERFYAMNPDGSGVTPVAALSAFNAALGQGLTLNQSGTFASMAFDSGTNSSIERRLVRLNDGATVLTFNTRYTSPQTVFAANSKGTKAAVAGSPTATDPYAIYLMNPDGTQKTQAAALPAGTSVSEITFAPDDQTLYFIGFPDTSTAFAGNGTLYKLAPGATAPVSIANVNTQISSLHTSRDGTKLAFMSILTASDFKSTAFTPYTLNADSTGLAKGVTTTLNEFVPFWDAVIASRTDGFHVLYVSSSDGARELFDMRPDGTQLKQITFNAAGNSIPGSRQAKVGFIRTVGGR